MAEQENASQTKTNMRRKGRGWGRRLRITLMIGGPVLLIAFGLWYYISHQGLVSTDDAFVRHNTVIISPQVAGRVIAVPVDTNDWVTRGELLLKLDPAPFKSRVDAAKAKLATAATQVQSLKAKYHTIAAKIEGAEAQVAYLDREVKRQAPLAKKNVITHAKLDKSRTALSQGRHQVAAFKAEQNQVLAQLDGDPDQPLDENAGYRAARAQLEQAQLNLSYTVVRAPADGQLGKVSVQVGDVVAVSKAAMPLVASDEVWVKANFKETALAHMRLGDPVKITVDSYPDYTWHGHVQSISPASGEIFSLLPPQNATGNWVKVVQRIPVRIAVEPDADAPQLRSGMSTSVTVNVRDHQHDNAARQ